ncbi:MAG: hypothetical protein V3S64_12425, partial [bacterium]
AQIVFGLEIEPELGRDVVVAAQAEGGVGGDGTLGVCRVYELSCWKDGNSSKWFIQAILFG